MVAVIQYNAGNIRSVANSLQRLNVPFTLTSNPEEICRADKVIFPGVGEASSTMAYLKGHRLDQVITDLRQPVLGICLGMQLMCSYSEENQTPCLGIFPLSVVRFPNGKQAKVPHVGWNQLYGGSGWMGTESNEVYAYFVHSYYVPVSAYTTSLCRHGIEFSAALQRDNYYAVQFHPEKSANEGQRILQRFLTL